MEGISLPLVWRVKAKSSSSFIPSLESIDILFFRFKRFAKYAFHANNKTCLVLWIFCKMAFESTTKTTSNSTFKRMKSFRLRGIDVSSSWISFNWLRPRLSAHFMDQAISRSGLRKCDELPAKMMFFDLWMSQFSTSWNSLVTNRSAVSDSSSLACRNYSAFHMWRLLAGKTCIQ